MAGFTVSDLLSTGFEIEIKVTYREPGEKTFYSDTAPTADGMCTALTAVYAKAFQEIVERVGDSPPMVRDL